MSGFVTEIAKVFLKIHFLKCVIKFQKQGQIQKVGLSATRALLVKYVVISFKMFSISDFVCSVGDK